MRRERAGKPAGLESDRYPRAGLSRAGLSRRSGSPVQVRLGSGAERRGSGVAAEDELSATPEQIASGAHRSRVDVGQGEVAAPEDGDDLVRVNAVGWWAPLAWSGATAKAVFLARFSPREPASGTTRSRQGSTCQRVKGRQRTEIGPDGRCQFRNGGCSSQR